MMFKIKEEAIIKFCEEKILLKYIYSNRQMVSIPIEIGFKNFIRKNAHKVIVINKKNASKKDKAELCIEYLQTNCTEEQVKLFYKVYKISNKENLINEIQVIKKNLYLVFFCRLIKKNKEKNILASLG